MAEYITGNKEFRVIGFHDGIEPGWRLATKEEVMLYKPAVVSKLNTWDIVAIKGEWKIDGAGYGNNVMRNTSGIGHKLVIKIRERVWGIRVISDNEGIPPRWRMATVSEVREMKPDVVTLLGTWTIAKFWAGWKIDGAGYGNVIQRHTPAEDKDIGDVVIVCVNEIQDDGTPYLDLHQMCEQGHSMHPFHGRPPQFIPKGRYSAHCGICRKECLENQPYFMHCYTCRYDVCTACAKLQVHFDQVEKTKCSGGHFMKAHRGFLTTGKTVNCCSCNFSKCLEKEPLYYSCLKCNEGKCVACSRHDIFILHSSASFMDSEDNYLHLELEFNESIARNELHLYKTNWDSEESAPIYIKKVNYVKLNMNDKTASFDNGPSHLVSNTYEGRDSWKEFVLDVIPLAKTCHVRIEYYNTHINKSGYPVYNSNDKAYCGIKVAGSNTGCSTSDQCEHCEHFTKKVEEKPAHSWWSSAGNFLSGFVDSIPVVGHIKGAVEYGLGYKDAAKKSFEAATRTTVVMGAGAAGLAAGGPAGAAGAGVAAGILFDAAESDIDSAIHKKWTPHGEMIQFTNIVQGNATKWDYMSLGMDSVFDGLGGADGAVVFKSSIKKGMEKGMAGELERDFDMKSLERATEEQITSKISEFPPHIRVQYHLKTSHWTPRSTGLDETNQIFREMHLERERWPKDDSFVRDGEKPVMTADSYTGRWFYENDFKLKNTIIKTVRSDVSKKKLGMECEIKKAVLKVVKKGMDMLKRKNVDHAVECQIHCMINKAVDTTGFSKSAIDKASQTLKTWQNSAENIWVVNARSNIWKRDATKALMKRKLNDDTILFGENAYKQALVHHNFKTTEANLVVNKVKQAFKNLKAIAEEKEDEEKKLIKRFVKEAGKTFMMSF